MKPESLFPTIFITFLNGVGYAQSTCDDPVVPVADPDPTAPITIHIVQFGAVPGNSCNDTEAFQEAGQFISNRTGETTLIIDGGPGPYIVGKQEPPQFPQTMWDGYLIGQHVLPIINRNAGDVIITGSLGAGGEYLSILKYDDCLKYGTFTPLNGNRYLPACDKFCVIASGSYFQLANLGACIHIENSSNITVENLMLDGTSGHLILGGKFGDTGIQADADGIDLFNSKNIALSNIDISNFGRDGIIIFNEPTHAISNAYLKDLNVHWNGRNGLSWVGGNTVHVENCIFSFSGIGPIKTDPRAGVDIEWQVGAAPVENGDFVNCKFMYNGARGLISDAFLNPVSNMVFTNCVFVGSEEGSALWPNARKMKFFQCEIYGVASNAFDARSTGDPSDMTYFDGCLFDDVYDGERISSQALPTSEPVVNFIHAGSLTMFNCRIRNHGMRKGMHISGRPDIDGMPPWEEWYARIENTRYTYEGGGNGSGIDICCSSYFSCNLNNVCYNDFIVRYPEYCGTSAPDGCGFSTSCPNYSIELPIPDQVKVTYCGICTDPICAACCAGPDEACGIVFEPTPTSDLAMSVPPAYQDPYYPSPRNCADCVTDADAVPCQGHHSHACLPPNYFACCDPCNCYVIEPPVKCEDLVGSWKSGRYSTLDEIPFQLSPNPTDDGTLCRILAKTDQLRFFELRVMDISGKKVVKIIHLSTIATWIPTGSIPSGTYIFQLFSGTELLGSRNLVIV